MVGLDRSMEDIALLCRNMEDPTPMATIAT
jgi:hypothetical protein